MTTPRTGVTNGLTPFDYSLAALRQLINYWTQEGDTRRVQFWKQLRSELYPKGE